MLNLVYSEVGLGKRIGFLFVVEDLLGEGINMQARHHVTDMRGLNHRNRVAKESAQSST